MSVYGVFFLLFGNLKWCMMRTSILCINICYAFYRFLVRSYKLRGGIRVLGYLRVRFINIK